MANTVYHQVLRRVLILIIALIVYGSLYPWHFVPVHLTENPLRMLLHSWRPQPLIYLIRDVIVNVALYIPLGFAAHLVFRKSRLPGLGFYGPVLLGLLLSSTMEMTQLLVPGRTTSMADLITNVVGSGFGMMLGLLFEALASRHEHRRPILARIVDRGALMLVFCWAAWLLFPLFPVMSRPEVHRKLLVFAHSRVGDPLQLVSAAASWFAAGLLSGAVGVRIPRASLALTLLVIPVQLFIVGRQPLPSFLLGALAGVVLFAVFHRGARPTKGEAWTFLAVIVARGFSPFHFVAGSSEFNWIPFAPMLTGDWQSLAGVLIEKIFYYGTAIWLLRTAGTGLASSVSLVAAVLALIEIAQIHLPGRTPEITDPILAILIGFALAMLSRPVRGRLRTAPLE